MQTPIRENLDIDAAITRALGMLHAGAALLDGVPPLIIPAGHLPEIPPAWRPVAGAESATPAERFAAYFHPGGAIVTVHATTDATEPDAAMIALITLGRHRITVSPAGTGGFAARWESGGIAYRLAAASAPFGTFMEILLNLRWPPR